MQLQDLRSEGVLGLFCNVRDFYWSRGLGEMQT